jgi:hypothetical protein
MALQALAQMGPQMAPYFGMATAAMALIGTSAMSAGRYGITQAYDAVTAPNARATITGIGGVAIATIAHDWYASDAKKELANMKYALDHLQQHFPGMQEFNFTDRDDTFRKIQELSKGVKALEIQHTSATELLTAVNSRVSTIWDRCDPHAIALMQKNGLATLSLSTEYPEQAAMQLASWVDATRQCHVDSAKYIKEIEECNLISKQATQDKEAAIKEKNEKQETVESLKERKGECKELEEIKLEKKQCQKTNSDLERSLIKLEVEKDKWKEKYEELSQQWFFRRWTGL